MSINNLTFRSRGNSSSQQNTFYLIRTVQDGLIFEYRKIAAIYDENGNDITTDEVLNNPIPSDWSIWECKWNEELNVWSTRTDFIIENGYYYQFRWKSGTHNFINDESKYYQFKIFGTNIEVMGKLSSLFGTTVLNSYNFYNLFADTKIKYANRLEFPTGNLAPHCYDSMFRNCTSLITVPQLAAITLANYCYSHMFDGCTALVTAPALPATTLAESCYAGMFDGCNSLLNTP